MPVDGVGRARGRHRRPVGGLRRRHGRHRDPRPRRRRASRSSPPRASRSRSIVLVMVVASVTLLPALLGLAGHRINRLSVRRRAARRPRTPGRAGSGGATHVSRHAAAPTPSARTVAAARARRAGARAAAGLPRRGHAARSRAPSGAPTTWSPTGSAPASTARCSSPSTSPGDPAWSTPLRAAHRGRPRHRRRSAPAEVRPRAGVATLLAFPTTAPQDEATRDTIERLRDRGASRARSPAARPRAHVGGQTAIFADIGDQGRRSAAAVHRRRRRCCRSCC